MSGLWDDLTSGVGSFLGNLPGIAGSVGSTIGGLLPGASSFPGPPDPFGLGGAFGSFFFPGSGGAQPVPAPSVPSTPTSGPGLFGINGMLQDVARPAVHQYAQDMGSDHAQLNNATAFTPSAAALNDASHRQPPPQALAPPSMSWTGQYAGGFGGGPLGQHFEQRRPGSANWNTSPQVRGPGETLAGQTPWTLGAGGQWSRTS